MGGGPACVMSSTPFGDAAANVKRLPRRLAEESADRFDQIARTAAARAVGNGGTMMVRRRGGVVPTTLGTEAAVTGGGGGAEARIHGTGPWVWIEDGTRPHVVGRSGDVLGGPHLRHPVKGAVRHLGSRGQLAWTRAFEVFEQGFDDLADQAMEEALGG